MSLIIGVVCQEKSTEGFLQMIPIPPALRTLFLESAGQVVPGNLKGAYLKWLRYYWDFCHKYHFPHGHRESLPYFIKKLQEKRQTQVQQEQAAHAIGLYYDLLASVPISDPTSSGSGQTSQEGNVAKMPELPGQSTSGPSLRQAQDTAQEENVVKGNARKESVLRSGQGASWQAEYARLAETLQDKSCYPVRKSKRFCSTLNLRMAWW